MINHFGKLVDIVSEYFIFEIYLSHCLFKLRAVLLHIAGINYASTHFHKKLHRGNRKETTDIPTA